MHSERGSAERVPLAFSDAAQVPEDACDLTLDPNTAHTRLILSDDNRKVTRVEDHQLFPDHPERFDAVPQVLCVESLTGRCYWEAEWSGNDAVISVSYKGINRKGWSDCWFGSNDKSWSLSCSGNSFTVHHNNNYTDIPVHSSSKRAGVYVDTSTASLTHTISHTYTHLTPHSLNPSVLDFGLVMIPHCLCVILNSLL
ncbi:Stonustoxin subunit beta [Labeo rohita]|uniref:Stonustoxin subunit beta n=1 Tax=Labeo rohita TaxID=84645 RepID=A0ABQ8L9M4_LABRO|nr:Stonustoxin subunit beta [Labeo rohita]